ncbi:MAG: TatD family hydrolase [Candidatus Kerfeldbacteria bacterium]|nr:TatD family hydrolase [Candidatus Kerfeldbacteria bacterium]
MKFIDTHAHVNFEAFKNDSPEVIQRALNAGVQMINVGTNYKTSARSVKLAEEVGNGMWAAIGVHPIHLAKDITEEANFNGQRYAFTTASEKFDKRAYFQLAKSSKVIAVGESGLDYFHLEDFRATNMTAAEFVELQKETLYEILGFAREIQRPNIFHCRDAYDDFVELVRDFGHNETGVTEQVRGVVHCFTGTMKQAEKILDLGLSIGFTGIVTFPNAQELQEIARQVPLDRILLETDCPYLAPQPVRGKRNEPMYVRYVAEKIAELKELTIEEVAETTRQNAIKLFRL